MGGNDLLREKKEEKRTCTTFARDEGRFAIHFEKESKVLTRENSTHHRKGKREKNRRREKAYKERPRHTLKRRKENSSKLEDKGKGSLLFRGGGDHASGGSLREGGEVRETSNREWEGGSSGRNLLVRKEENEGRLDYLPAKKGECE